GKRQAGRAVSLPTRARSSTRRMSNLRIALRQTSARRLFAAHAQSCVGSGMAYVALPLLAYEFTGSAWAVAAVLLPEIAPAIVLGPLLGALIDRFGWRRTMV